jgi:predicted dehydrogenase/threonine dehydrogenase-like Zn-dependent dehydrogenase
MAQKSLVDKARARPDLVKQVIQKAKTEGLVNTFQAVRSKLSSWSALGYSASGIVAAVGADVSGFKVGDRVACAGAGYASHAEVISVPKNLCVQLPDQVSFEEGAFGTLGAIAMQGVRLAEPTLGEAVVVVGLGLIGQITVQLLKANGCRVFGVDIDPEKIQLARESGADEGSISNDETVKRVLDWTRGRGADAVLITAATSSNQPVELAGEVSRIKGRVVAVGLVGTQVPRDIYYRRELTFKISMSYGPGRYDPEYEERGHDYPFGYVRWTEARNIEAFLDLIESGRVSVRRLITHRFAIEQGEEAYRLISGETKEPYLGIVLQYDPNRELETRIVLEKAPSTPAKGRVELGLIGAGGYAKAMLLPNFKSEGANFRSIATASGVSARETGERYGFGQCVSSADEVIGDPSINLVVIATRHNTHAELVCRALSNGHHVFVEKPLAMNDVELDSVLEAARSSSASLMVGFNRRFSPHANEVRGLFKNHTAPLSILYRVNAGRIPTSSWIQDPKEGGGRIIGEVCHFIDLVHFLTESVTTRVFAEAIVSRNAEVVNEDSVFITLRLANGSNASIAYLAEGDKTMPKERIEISGEGTSAVIDDFRSLTVYRNGRSKQSKLSNQDKGQRNEVKTVCQVVTGAVPAPIALDDLAATTRATFRILESIQTGQAVEL